MGERKVLNKYFPPDFDPSLVPRTKKPKDKQQEVRMMLPYTFCCNTCGEFMYRAKKSWASENVPWLFGPEGVYPDIYDCPSDCEENDLCIC